MRYKVILLDDEEEIRLLLRYLLEKSAHSLQILAEAGDGEEGLALCRKHRPHMVFADIRMPGLDGLALLAALKEELPNTQVILVSGYSLFSYAQEAIRHGACAYLLKPVEEEALEEAIRKAKTVIRERERQRRERSNLELAVKKLAAQSEESSREQVIYSSNEQMQRVLSYVHANFEKDLTLEEVAGLIYMTPAYFSTLFKREVGESFVAYINGLRMRQAAKLLREGALKATEIAQMTGFRDVSYFNRVFKKYFGHTPSEHKAP